MEYEAAFRCQSIQPEVNHVAPWIEMSNSGIWGEFAEENSLRTTLPDTELLTIKVSAV